MTVHDTHFKGIITNSNNWNDITFKNCIFEDCSFLTSDFRLTFENCSIKGTTFKNCRILGSTFTNCKLSGVRIYSCNILNLTARGTTLVACHIYDCSINGIDISIKALSCRMSQSEVDNAKVKYATLNGANLSSCILNNIFIDTINMSNSTFMNNKAFKIVCKEQEVTGCTRNDQPLKEIRSLEDLI